MSSEAQRPTLPLELCDQIMDCLWDNPRALAACGATSREWVPTSRLHLFRRVILHGGRQCLAFQDILETSPLAPVSFAPYIHELVISKEGSDEMDDDWTNETLLSVLYHLNQVECLTLRSLQSTDLEVEALMCLSTFSSLIHTLYLESVEFEDGMELRQLLFNYPKLSTISLRAVTWEYCTKSAGELTSATPEHVEKISIHSLVVEDALHSDEAHGPKHSGIEAVTYKRKTGAPLKFSLHNLEWSSHAQEKQFKILNSLLREAGPKLQSLKVSLHPRDIERVHLHGNFTLAFNTCLTTVQIVCPRDGSTTLQCAWVPTLLKRIHSTRLQEIRMVFGSCGFQNIFVDFINWKLVDAALAELHQQLPLLAVVFQIGRHNEVSNEYVMTAIISRLPTVRGREMRIGSSVTRSVVVNDVATAQELVQWW